MEDKFKNLDELLSQRHIAATYFSGHHVPGRVAELTRKSFDELIAAEIKRLAIELFNMQPSEDENEDDD